MSDGKVLEQLRELVSSISVPDDLAEMMFAEIERRKRADESAKRSFSQNLKRQLAELEAKLDKLVNGFLDGDIGKSVYLKKKEQLLSEKVHLTNQKGDFEKKGVLWFELARECVETLQAADSVKDSENLREIKAFVKKIGSNRLLLDKKVLLDFALPFDLLPIYLGKQKKAPQGECGAKQATKSKVALCRDEKI